MRCHWIYEEETFASFIPGCIGGAIAGPEGCTCNHPLSEIEREQEARREAEEYIEALRSKARRRQEFIDSLMRKNKRLYAEIRYLREVAEK